MIDGKRIILYELNEVPRRVLEDFASRNPASTFARVLQLGTFFETFTEDKGLLSPWITWPTLHRGVPNDKHCIRDFGQDLSEVNAEYPSFLDLLARAGISVGVFGSLHSYPPPPNVNSYAFYLPDTFANGPECFPETLSSFQDFNLKMVDASARNVSNTILLGPALRFMRQAPGLGLRFDTACRLAGQLIAERLKPALVARRRTSQIEIAFDLFHKQLAVNQPQMCTFFTNHVASSMHRYWPAKFPGDYSEIDLGSEWHETYAGEIDFTMAVADRQLARLAEFVERDSRYVLLIASSMGQAAVDTSCVIRSQLLIEDMGKFLGAIGVASSQWTKRRAMLPRYVLKIADDAVSTFRKGINDLTINGEPLPLVELGNNIFQIELGHANQTDDVTLVRLRGTPQHLRNTGLANTAIQDESGSYAYHIPQGILIVYNPAKRDGRERGTISTLDVAPTLLSNFGVPKPSYMRSVFC